MRSILHCSFRFARRLARLVPALAVGVAMSAAQAQPAGEAGLVHGRPVLVDEAVNRGPGRGSRGRDEACADGQQDRDERSPAEAPHP